MLLLDIQFDGDITSSLAMIERTRLRLSAAPLAGWMNSFVDPFLKTRTAMNFASESAPKGDPWAPLAPSTIQRRLDEGYAAGPIQYRTGEMYDYFTTNRSDVTAMVSGVKLTYPSEAKPPGKLKYKIGSAQSGNMRTGAPPRPVLGMTLQDGEAIMMGLFEYIVGPL